MADVIVETKESFRTEVRMGRHTFVADEPESAGGGDEGPNPYQLLAAALGTCKNMTLRYYAKREGIPLEGVRTWITHERKHARDCSDCEQDSGYIHEFHVKLQIEGSSLTSGQRAKLLEIAGRCPVAKTLKNEIRIRDEIV